MFADNKQFFHTDRRVAANKNYMSIGVLVRTTKPAARNNGIGVRQENNPQSPTTYSSEGYATLLKRPTE